MGEFITPANEADILPTLSSIEQEHYVHVRDSAIKVSKKHPDMHTAIYTDYLSSYLDYARDNRTKTHSSEGIPLDAGYVKSKFRENEKAFASEFDKKYPIFAKEDASPEEKKIAEANNTAFRRLEDEVSGGGIIGNITKAVYDEDKGGMQWGSIAGGALGLLAFGAIGSFIAGAAGGGWAGTIVIALLGITGMIAGSQLGNYLTSDKKEETGSGLSPEQEKAQQKALSQAMDGANKEHDQQIDKALEKAKGQFMADGGMSDAEQKAYDALSKEAGDVKKVLRDNIKEITPAVFNEHNQIHKKFNKDGSISESEQKALDLLVKNAAEANEAILAMPKEQWKEKGMAKAFGESLDESYKKAEGEYRDAGITKEDSEAGLQALKNMFTAMKKSGEEHEKALLQGLEAHTKLKGEFKKDGLTDEENKALAVYDKAREEIANVVVPQTPSAPPATEKTR